MMLPSSVVLPSVLHLWEPPVWEELSLVRPTLGPSALRVQRDDGQACQLSDVEVSLHAACIFALFITVWSLFLLPPTFSLM